MFEADVRATKEAAAQEIFGKGYGDLTAGDLHELAEEMMKGLLMFRKNAPFGFVRMINLVLGHPATRFLDRNNLRVALELFDFDINELNGCSFLVEQDVDMQEGLKSEQPLKDVSCHEVFFGPSTPSELGQEEVPAREAPAV